MNDEAESINILVVGATPRFNSNRAREMASDLERATEEQENTFKVAIEDAKDLKDITNALAWLDEEDLAIVGTREHVYVPDQLLNEVLFFQDIVKAVDMGICVFPRSFGLRRKVATILLELFKGIED